MKKIYSLFCIFLIFYPIVIHSQSLNCLWLDYSQCGNSYTNNSCVDLNGNSIVMGYFLTINIQGTSLISNPPSKFNIFISKTDSSGNLLWLKHVGEGNECEGKSIITDSQNNIIFTGYFREQITLCDSTLVTNDIVGEFIMKLDQNGNCLWIDYVDFTGSFGPIPLVVDNLDNIYMLTPGNTTINGFSTIGKTVITKFNQQGQVIWMKPTGINMLYLPSNGSDYMVMNSNKIILGGYYKDTITFAGNTYISGIERWRACRPS